MASIKSAKGTAALTANALQNFPTTKSDNQVGKLTTDTEQAATMMRAERADLLAHLKRRERVQKSAAKQRSAELLAEFEHNMAARYSFDDDAVWNEAALIAEREVEKARKRVAERCRELGIPKQFAPSPRFYWSERGENAIKERRSELRKAAQTRIAAIEKDALVQIERETLEAETEPLKNGMTSDSARARVGLHVQSEAVFKNGSPAALKALCVHHGGEKPKGGE